MRVVLQDLATLGYVPPPDVLHRLREQLLVDVFKYTKAGPTGLAGPSPADLWAQGAMPAAHLHGLADARAGVHAPHCATCRRRCALGPAALQPWLLRLSPAGC